ncbi:MAG: hypothetical protein NTW66_01590 [Candidatus Magasanikbacteria bacterium]|nr:hypothetical protein [Candidatus Magasanikbacteria bacterium]
MLNRQNNNLPKKYNLTPNEKNYMIWLFSTLSFMIAVIAVLCVYGIIIYHRALNLFNSTNEQIVQKTGLEMTSEINSAAVELVEKIISKKIETPQLPEKARNIFFYNSYINILPPAAIPEIITATTSGINSDNQQ